MQKDEIWFVHEGKKGLKQVTLYRHDTRQLKARRRLQIRVDLVEQPVFPQKIAISNLRIVVTSSSYHLFYGAHSSMDKQCDIWEEKT